jgi:hypothetical protein
MPVALKAAAVLAGQMDGHITVLSVAHVPWPAPLIGSADAARLFARRVNGYAGCADGRELSGHLVFARESEAAYRDCLKPGSLVLITTHSRRWTTREERLARSLIKQRIRVILLKVE